MNSVHLKRAAAFGDEFDPFSLWAERTHDHAPSHGVRAEDRMRVRVDEREQSLGVFAAQL
ncbi:MAG TPA: hypothetical protein VJT74_00395 [Pyrinomonadaceae bacterium]|nr:hypothetical protein [Pyrinomonadaceae bacterium]